MATIIAASVAGSTWLALLFLGIRAFLAYLAANQAPGQVQDSQWTARLAALEVTVAGLPSLWNEERSRAERAAERARVADARATKKRRASQDDDDADDDVRAEHARGSNGQGMLPLHEDMGGASAPPSTIPSPWALAGLA